MRKNCFRLLSLTVLAVAVTSISAFAADASIVPGEDSAAGVTITPNGAEKVDVAYNSAESGKEYLIMVQSEDGTPTETNLVYIDQITAGTSNVTFTVNPKGEMTNGKIYHVYLSSSADSGITTRQKVGTFEYKAGTSEYTLGDVDNNGSVEARDAQFTLQIAAKLRTPTELQKLAADVDGKSGIEARDAQFILQAAAHLRQLS